MAATNKSGRSKKTAYLWGHQSFGGKSRYEILAAIILAPLQWISRRMKIDLTPTRHRRVTRLRQRRGDRGEVSFRVMQISLSLSLLFVISSCSILEGKSLLPYISDNFDYGSFNKEAAQKQADEFQSRYTGVVDDMVAFADAPDFTKAEKKRQKLVTEANLLASRFQELADKLQASSGKSGTDKTKGLPGFLDFSGFDILDKATFKKQANEFEVKYTSIMDDLSSFQNEADYRRAEEQRQKLIEEASSLAATFQKLANTMQARLDKTSKGIAPDLPPTIELPGFNINKNALQDKVNELQSKHNNLVDDIVSHENNPNYDKAEEQRLKLITEANNLVFKLQELANKLQNILNKIAGKNNLHPK